ncbi:MAG TPA: SIMPL domain-containing protein [Candidatus Magasanikbacteria bacterium]|nr:SIMPL domain-containing protein [Candidatus Magasanikbacteria bacterium]
MPINPKIATPSSELDKKACGTGCVCCRCGYTYGKKIIMVILAVLLLYGIFYIGAISRNTIKGYNFIGKAPQNERSISINGYGKITGRNDIAVTTIGFSNTDKEVSTAQLANKKVMDQVMVDLQKMGIEDKDLQSNYMIYPEYNYTQNKGTELKGYKVTNNITVKVRDLSKVNDVLNLAGKYGANEVSGLNFTIDDPENLKKQAREKALADAKEKAQILADKLGVKLGGVMYYSEYEASNDYYAPKYFTGAEGGGIGGGYSPESTAGGSKDVVMNVSVTYEILR